MKVCYVIHPYAESHFLNYDGDLLEACRKEIGCTTIEIGWMRDDIAMWVDEEATLTGQPKNISATLAMSKARDRFYPVWGTAVFTGYRNGRESDLPEDFHSLVADSLVVRLR